MKVLKVFQALTFIFFVALAQRAHAAPGLKVSFKDANSKLAFSFSPSPSVTDCSYEIFGSERKNLIRRKSPAKKASLAEFGKLDPDGEDFQISELPHIKKTKKQKKRVAYFRLRETCNTSSSGSAVKKLRLPSSKKNGSTSKIWFQEISKQFEYFNLRYTDAFPQLTFTRPSDIRNANDGSNRLFVVELTGTIKVFPNESAVASADTFLDLSDKISLGGERGLFSLAFHPNFPTNRFVYVHYSEKGTGATVIARYTVRQDNPNQVDAATEKIIFYLGQPDSVHNGGSILFGTDGYLYITLGDGGTQGDLHGNGQNRTTYYGSILRIDVDNEQDSKSYAIPTDNPFVGNSEGFLEEIYAWGFRNPWRASFDRATHELYVGDVGQSSVEEVDIVLPGRNYGWNVMEASSCFAASSCEQTGLELPIYEYPHATGLSITGGYVYRGTDLDFLTGQYVFGDFTLGKLFILKKTPDGYEAFERFDTDFFISTFGEDEAGELYFGDYGSGKVYRLLARDS